MNFREYKQRLRELRKEAHDFAPDPDYNPSEWGEDWCPQCQSPMYWTAHPGSGLPQDKGAWVCTHCGWRGPSGWNHTPEEPSEMAHPDPWMDNEPGSLTLPEHWGARRASHSPSDTSVCRQSGVGDLLSCPECGGRIEAQGATPEHRWFKCQSCGQGWEEDEMSKAFPAPDSLGVSDPAWQPEGYDLEAFSPSGHRCPMCKNPRLIEEGHSLLCPACKWAGEKFDDPSGPRSSARLSGMDNAPSSPYSHPLAMQLTLLKHEQGDHVQPQPGCPACIAEFTGSPSQVVEWNGLRPRRSGMDDPTPDPEFDQERAQMPEQTDMDRKRILEGLESIRPDMERFMRTRGMGEPDWAPLEHVIPPSHLGDWMFMGYGDDGQREYKHYHTRRYLNLLPQDEIPQQARFDNYNRLHLFNRRYVPRLRFHQPNGEVGPYQPVDMNYALDHAYHDIDYFTGGGENGANAMPHPYPQGYPSTEWEHMEVPPWERPPYQQQQPGPSDIDPYADLR